MTDTDTRALALDAIAEMADRALKSDTCRATAELLALIQATARIELDRHPADTEAPPAVTVWQDPDNEHADPEPVCPHCGEHDTLMGVDTRSTGRLVWLHGPAELGGSLWAEVSYESDRDDRHESDHYMCAACGKRVALPDELSEDNIDR